MVLLITGGAGYIGSHVLKLVLEKSDKKVLVIDNFSTGTKERLEILQKIRSFDVVELDLANTPRLEEVLKSHKIDEVIHFAASIVVPESMENPLKYYSNNTANTIGLVQACVQNKIKKFIFSSTAAVYGEPENVPVNEQTPPNPINLYGTSKLMSENVIRDASLAHPEFKHVILRYFNVAGASMDGTIGQSFPNATHLIKVAAEVVAGKREKIAIFGDDYPTPDGTCVRDYIHVDDLADAHLKSLQYLSSNKSDTFNVGYGRGFSVKEVLEAMDSVAGIQIPRDLAPRRAGDPAILVANVEKIKKTMPWKPQFEDLNKICASALNWERRNLCKRKH